MKFRPFQSEHTKALFCIVLLCKVILFCIVQGIGAEWHNTKAVDFDLVQLVTFEMQSSPELIMETNVGHFAGCRAWYGNCREVDGD